VPKALLELGKVPLLERQSVLGVFGGMLREVSLRHEDRRLGTLQPALQATELVLRCSPAHLVAVHLRAPGGGLLKRAGALGACLSHGVSPLFCDDPELRSWASR
jgi:hypothetical protein